jgi:hypothetical protein
MILTLYTNKLLHLYYIFCQIGVDLKADTTQHKIDNYLYITSTPQVSYKVFIILFRIEKVLTIIIV